jgi:hypothetical protein
MVVCETRCFSCVRIEQGGGGPGIQQHPEGTVAVDDRVDENEAVFDDNAVVQHGIVVRLLSVARKCKQGGRENPRSTVSHHTFHAIELSTAAGVSLSLGYRQFPKIKAEQNS